MKKSLILILFFTISSCFFVYDVSFAENSKTQQNIEDMKKAGKDAKNAFELTIKNWWQNTKDLYSNTKEWASDKDLLSPNKFLQDWAIKEGFFKPDSCEELNRKNIIDQASEEANELFCQQFANADFSDTWKQVQTVINESDKKRNLVFVFFDDFFKTSEPLSYSSSNYKDSMIKLFNNPKLIKISCSNPCLCYKLDKALKAFFIEMQKLSEKEQNISNE